MEAAGVAVVGEVEITSTSKPPAVLSPERCSGCGRCIAACPEKLYSLELVNRRKYSINRSPEKCCCCGKCIASCPLDIISVQSITP